MQAENTLKCPNCLSPVGDNAESCSNCKVDFYNCSNCNALILETDTVCKNCNSRLDGIQDRNNEIEIPSFRPIHEYKSLDVPTKILLLLLSSGIFFSFINIYSDANNIASLQNNINSGGISYYEENYYYNLAMMISNVLALIIYISSAVIYFIWIRQAYRNLHTLQLRRTEYSSGWAIGAYFVPFINYVRPYRMMKEIWFGSQPEYALSEEDDQEFYNRRYSDTILKSWWAVFLIDWHITQFSIRFSMKVDTAEKLLTSHWIDIISISSGIFLSFIALYMVSMINAWQSEKINSKPKKYCQHCGNLVEIDAMLCTNCGKQLIYNY